MLLSARQPVMPTLPGLGGSFATPAQARPELEHDGQVTVAELARFLGMFDHAPQQPVGPAPALRADPCVGSAAGAPRRRSWSLLAPTLCQFRPEPVDFGAGPAAKAEFGAPPHCGHLAGSPHPGGDGLLMDTAGAGADTVVSSLAAVPVPRLEAASEAELDGYLSELSESLASSPMPPGLDDLSDAISEALSELHTLSDVQGSRASLVGVGELTSSLALAAVAMPASPLETMPPLSPAAGVTGPSWPMPLNPAVSSGGPAVLYPLTQQSLAALELARGGGGYGGGGPAAGGTVVSAVGGVRHRHICRYCPKAFVTPSKRARHERIHTGDKPYGCGHCPQRFTQRCGLKAHSYLHAREAMAAPAASPNQPGSLHTQKINGFLVSELLAAMQRSVGRKEATRSE